MSITKSCQGHILSEVWLLVWFNSIFSSRSWLPELSLFYTFCRLQQPEGTAEALQKRIRSLGKFGNCLPINKVKSLSTHVKYTLDEKMWKCRA